jgi:hypothetical protein
MASKHKICLIVYCVLVRPVLADIFALRSKGTLGHVKIAADSLPPKQETRLEIRQREVRARRQRYQQISYKFLVM